MQGRASKNLEAGLRSIHPRSNIMYKLLDAQGWLSKIYDPLT
jgi:hypothetical protein